MSAARPRVLIPAAAIARRVHALAQACAARLAREPRPLAVVLLDGAAVFAADLLRACPALDWEVCYLRVSSYGAATSPQRPAQLQGALPALTGRRALLIDDILDTGLTLAAVRRALLAAGAAEVLTCVLLDKPARRHPEGLPRADLAGFAIPPCFVVGYGLDHAGRWRHLPYIGAAPTDPC